MEDKIINSLSEYLIQEESKKLVGKVCKRFELAIDQANKNKKNNMSFEEVNNIKANVKELVYEWCRDIRDSLKTGKIVLDIVRKEK